MTYAEREASSYGGVPLSLYEFTRGAQVWRYTGADQDVDDYVAVPISDSGFTESGEASQDGLTVTVPWSLPVVELFTGTPPSSAVYLKIFRRHEGDGETVLRWMGSISQVRRTDAASAEITCSTLAATFDRNGLRLSWARTCPYVLYDHNTCKVDKAAFAVVGTIIGINAIGIQVSGFDAVGDGYFNGGFIEWEVTSGTFERRAVQTHIGTGLYLMGLTDGLVAGTVITGYRGCDRTVQTCNDVFANIGNNGSDPFLPGKSPFAGTMVF